ncbi:MAG: FtsQ-type POTRA domain-containing protein [Desulfobacteraceae bacterium]|nr:FtsQ-type POTRA domain-containing protein [Desulfobacteraceae bacterium]
MKQRALLVNRPVKRKRQRPSRHGDRSYGVKRYILPVFSVVHRIGSGMVKVLILVAVMAVISLSFISLYHYLLSSPYMKLERVEVEGVEGTLRDELITSCSLNSNLNLLALNLNKLKKEMERHPWVRSVRLERQFPHSLIVRAEKERPLGVLAMEKLYYINRRGEVFKEVSPSEGVDFPLVTGVDRAGSKRREQLRRAAFVMRNLEAEEGPWSLNRLSEINVREDEMLSLYYNDIGAEIKLMENGFGSGMGKLRRVSRHLKETGQIDQVNKVDLTYTDGVVVSFRDGIKGKVVKGG